VNLSVRQLSESDLPEADRIFRAAFGTFLGMPDPTTFGGDSDLVWTRWRADPSAALGAFHDGVLVGSNFVTHWGSFSFFGPLSVRPDLWDQGIARHLMEATVPLLERDGAPLSGLMTFPNSPKHIRLYQRFGFWPQSLIALFGRPVSTPATNVAWRAFSQVSDRDLALSQCAWLTGEIFNGLDVRRDILAVADQDLGDTVLIDDENGKLTALAVCHTGAGSEAGSGSLFVKFAAVRPGPDRASVLGQLLGACDDLAVRRGAGTVTTGVNAARHECYAQMLDAGFRVHMHGVAMLRPDSPGFNRAGVYVLDDWR
jgi:GNAT superfamily N-acetyltransferase